MTVKYHWSNTKEGIREEILPIILPTKVLKT